MSTALVRISDMRSKVDDFMRDNISVGKASYSSVRTSGNVAGKRNGAELGRKINIRQKGVIENKR
jgi:hypothetical protein